MGELDNSKFFDTQEEIDLTKESADNSLQELNNLTREFSEMVAKRKKAESDLESAMGELGRLQEAIIKIFENIGGGMKSVRNEKGLFTLSKLTTVSINQEKYDEAVRWVEMQGGSGLFKKSAHWKALSSFVQNTMKESGDQPPDCFNVNEVKRITFTAKKG